MGAYRGIRVGGVTIMTGNSKLGNIPNVSLTPGPCGSCANGAKCFEGGCYARKFMMRRSVRECWARNLEAARNDRSEYFGSINEFLYEYKPKYFRWHVAGDILDLEYLNLMVQLAYEHKRTHFLCYTRRHDLLRKWHWKPGNLVLAASTWPGDRTEVTDNVGLGYPRAHVDFGRGAGKNADDYLFWYQVRVEGLRDAKAKVVRCKGSCETCKRCWNLKPGEHVVFPKH